MADEIGNSQTATADDQTAQQKQEDAQRAASAAIDKLQRDSNQGAGNNPNPQGGYRGPTEAELKAREQENARQHSFVVAVKALLDALAPEPKLGKVESAYFAVYKEYRDLIGEPDARDSVQGDKQF
jgi:hypothetical protein